MRNLIMRYLMTPICLVLSVLITGTSRAEDDAPNKEDRAGRRAEMRQKMLDEFDADGDGDLSETERTTAREQMRSRRADKSKGAKGAKGSQGRKRATQRGKGRRGSGGPPDAARLFNEHDANGDGQLSREEYMKLTAAVRSSRPPHGPGQRGGPRSDGPPPAGRRRFDRDSPLQNRGDRPGPPPRPAGRRRQNGEQGARGRVGPRNAHFADRRGVGRRGVGGHDAGGPVDSGAGVDRHGPPNPERIFEHLDANNDDQLSRDEFVKLADRMREMRDRGGSGGERGQHGTREGRGRRRGPAGEDGPPRRRRPPRLEPDGPDSDSAGSDSAGSDSAGSDAAGSDAAGAENPVSDDSSV